MAKTKKTPAKKLKPKKTIASAKKAANLPDAKAVKPVKKVPAKKKVKKKSNTLMCFLTTACVRHYGLPDNGYALNTLRHYRDTYLATSRGGSALIEQYYRVSPGIVRRVDRDTEKTKIYAFIYKKVQLACAAIEAQNFYRAKSVYVNLVKSLMTRYQIQDNKKA